MIYDAGIGRLGSYTTNYSRFQRLIDGDGSDEILLAHARAVRRDGPHALPAGARRRLCRRRRRSGPGNSDTGPFAVVGDMTGNGRVDIVAHTERRVHVYEGIGQPTKAGTVVGTPVNFTLY